ncbi:MAG: toxin-antitoxin system HicB family antitoxin [Bacteroidales bacterium]|nr:toxin-antitoxin system HicB family antitoxin [Bacteroidales bacterium]
METPRESALIRLRPELMARAKRQAKAEHISFNAFVEKTIARAVEPEWPVLPKDFKVSEEILGMACVPAGWAPSKEELEADPRLAHIWGECSYED